MADFLDEYRQAMAEVGAGCGPHCPGNRIPLLPYELARIARSLGVTTGEAIRSCLQDASPLLAVKSDGTCVFHRPEGCEVHADRPMSCRNVSHPAEDTGRYVERARQYRAVLREWVAARAGEEDATEGGVPQPVPELGTWILDVDSLVAERCRERGISVPEDVESCIDLHLDALRSVLL